MAISGQQQYEQYNPGQQQYEQYYPGQQRYQQYNPGQQHYEQYAPGQQQYHYEQQYMQSGFMQPFDQGGSQQQYYQGSQQGHELSMQERFDSGLAQLQYGQQQQYYRGMQQWYDPGNQGQPQGYGVVPPPPQYASRSGVGFRGQERSNWRAQDSGLGNAQHHAVSPIRYRQGDRREFTGHTVSRSDDYGIGATAAPAGKGWQFCSMVAVAEIGGSVAKHRAIGWKGLVTTQRGQGPAVVGGQYCRGWAPGTQTVLEQCRHPLHHQQQTEGEHTWKSEGKQSQGKAV